MIKNIIFVGILLFFGSIQAQNTFNPTSKDRTLMFADVMPFSKNEASINTIEPEKLKNIPNGSKKDVSLKNKFTAKKYLLPITLIISGVIINNSDFEKKIKLDIRNKVGNDFEFLIDNYIQFAPIVELYSFDLLKIKSKNNWFDQTKFLFISDCFSTGIVLVMKYLTNKTRPNGSPYSFPSGHTTFAFTNATVFFNEFHETAPVLAYSSYIFSTTTGAFRIINNKHWLSDVLVGAGIGLTVANLVYYFEPFKNFNPFKRSKNITFVPKINDDYYGLYFSYKF